MYSWEKTQKVWKNPKSPSFSSSLLDEIYREIDGGTDVNFKDFKQSNEKIVKKTQSSNNNVNGGGSDRAKASGRIVEDEEMTSLRRACLIEKWMEKKVNEKVSSRRGSLLPDEKYFVRDNDPLFFSSSSCSSDSSFGGFSSSETESFGAGNIKHSSFPAPKPIRTNVQKIDQFYLFDDYSNHQTNKTEGLIKSKTRAVKIYENLKKMKQPISPGGRLTGFINALFTHGDPKKTKNSHDNHNAVYDMNYHSTQKSSKCSSASSYSRSCLSSNSARAKDNLNNGTKRTVSFFPVSVIVDDQHSHLSGHKCISENSKQNQRTNDFVSRKCCKENIVDDYEDDAASDSSSDLFELDHLTVFKDDRFSDDLPVYETTHMGKNRAIATGYIP